MLVLLWHSNEREANKQIGTILNLFYSSSFLGLVVLMYCPEMQSKSFLRTYKLEKTWNKYRHMQFRDGSSIRGITLLHIQITFLGVLVPKL